MEEKDTRTPQANSPQHKPNGKNFHRHKKGKHFSQNRGGQNLQNKGEQGAHQTQNNGAFRHVSADAAFGMTAESKPSVAQNHASDAQNQQNRAPHGRKNRRDRRNRGRFDRQNQTKAPLTEEAATPEADVAQELPIAEEVPQEQILPPVEEVVQIAQPLAEEEATEVPEADKAPVEMTEIVGVHFKHTAKVYYFDPNGLNLDRYQKVIVQTANGNEYGEVTVANRMIATSELVLPLRPVLRVATEEDEKRHGENADREIEAYNACVAKIAEHKLEMKLVDTEMSFDRTKLLFYYTAEERVDFRELVKELAAAFHTRIEMRQIGIRDEAKMLGGLGICGRPFCCSTFLPDFAQVSIKMAKEQNLSLNSAKISGACGRLMCCLRYEHSTYEAELKITPKVDSLVTTADGDGVVTESNPLTGLLKVRLDGEENTRVYAREAVVVNGHQKGASRRPDPRKALAQKQENANEKGQNEEKNNQNRKK